MLRKGSGSSLMCFWSLALTLCRTFWTLMLSWMKWISKNQIQLPSKLPAVEKPARRKPAKTGEVFSAVMLEYYDITQIPEQPQHLLASLHEAVLCLCVCSTCGLAEELQQESKGQPKPDLPKSACGSVSALKPLLVSSSCSGANKR